MSACRTRQAKESQDQSSVGLVSTLPKTEPQDSGEVPHIQKDSEVDPRFKSHCTLVTVTAPDCSRHVVCALWDTGARFSKLLKIFLSSS